MTKKLYLDDSYTTQFEATVDAVERAEPGWLVELTPGSFFYPESGGQPADRGVLGGAPVVDVQLSEGRIVHRIEGRPPEAGSTVSCAIDWERRYDHMQQHTGQHLLTAAFLEVLGAGTVGFHLGEQESTIDIAKADLGAAIITRAEELCSRWVRAALPIHIDYVDADEFARLDLRKKSLPEELEGPVRLIRIEQVDTAHCGGTHLRNTAELQMVKVLASERVRDSSRVFFLAGRRAVQDYSNKHRMLSDLARDYTCGLDALPSVLAKARARSKEVVQELKKTRKDLIKMMVGPELAEATKIGRHVILVREYAGWGADELKALAGALTSADQRLLFCGGGLEEGHGAIVLAAGGEYEGDLGDALRTILPLFDGRGGGRGRFAQAVGNAEQLEQAMARAESILRELGENG